PDAPLPPPLPYPNTPSAPSRSEYSLACVCERNEADRCTGWARWVAFAGKEDGGGGDVDRADATSSVRTDGRNDAPADRWYEKDALRWCAIRVAGVRGKPCAYSCR